MPMLDYPSTPERPCHRWIRTLNDMICNLRSQPINDPPLAFPCFMTLPFRSRISVCHPVVLGIVPHSRLVQNSSFLNRFVPPPPQGYYPRCNGSDFSHVNRLIWWSPRAAQLRIGRCGWKAVAEMGELRLCWRKLEYGSTRESSCPSRLNTLTVCADVPLSMC